LESFWVEIIDLDRLSNMPFLTNILATWPHQSSIQSLGPSTDLLPSGTGVSKRVINEFLLLGVSKSTVILSSRRILSRAILLIFGFPAQTLSHQVRKIFFEIVSDVESGCVSGIDDIETELVFVVESS